MRLSHALVVAAILQSVLVGCTYRAAFNPSPYVDESVLKPYASARTPKSPAEIVFLREPPKQDFIVLGTVDAPVIEWTAHYTTEDLIQAMRVKAAEIGGDAIIDFRIKHDPSVHTVGNVTVGPRYTYGTASAVPYKGLHAWGEVIMFVPKDVKDRMEPAR